MRRILLDTDLAMGQPGSDIDDGFALALAVADPSMTVELVSTVAGNTDVDTATRLTGDLLRRLGVEIPVARGAAQPLLRAAAGRSLARGGGEPARPAGPGRVAHAAVALAERVLAEPGALTLVAIGPLTNVALALALEPRVAYAVREIMVMGGAYLEHTNVAAMPGEFNFWSDPEAAAMVLASGAPLRLVGLDVTRRVRLHRADAARMAASGRGFATFAAACTDEWITHLERVRPGEGAEHGSCALHDPLVVAAASRPELVGWRRAHVTVETAGHRTRGMAVADLLTVLDAPEANCQIAVGVDAAAFRTHLLGCLESLP